MMIKSSADSINGKFVLARKPAIWLLIIATLGLALRVYAPADWEVVRTCGGLVQMFCMGVLAAQHLPIWAPSAAPKIPADYL